MSSQTVFFTAGSTSKSIDVALVQKAAATSPGDPLTGLLYNTASLSAYARNSPTVAPAAITLATQTVTGAWSSGGLVELDSTHAPGMYRFDIPNTWLATAGQCSVTFTGAANLATHTVFIIVTAVDLYDAVRGGMTALPNAAAGAAGGLIAAGTGTNQISLASGQVLVQSGTAAGQLSVASGVIAANVTAFGGTAGTFAGGRPEVNTTFFGGTLGTFATGIPAVNAVQWKGVAPNSLVSGRVDTTVGATQAGTIVAATFATDAVDTNALAASAATEIAAAIKATVIETNASVTVGQALSVMLAALAGVTSGGGNTLKDPSGTSSRIVATIDGSNNRTAMSLTPST